jgi:hypothetical protein
MRDCLGAASHVVQVRDGLGADHPKSIQALGRDIDVPRFVKWRRAHEKYVLCLDKGTKVGVDFRVHLAHDNVFKESRDGRTAWISTSGLRSSEVNQASSASSPCSAAPFIPAPLCRVANLARTISYHPNVPRRSCQGLICLVTKRPLVVHGSLVRRSFTSDSLNARRIRPRKRFPRAGSPRRSARSSTCRCNRSRRSA